MKIYFLLIIAIFLFRTTYSFAQVAQAGVFYGGTSFPNNGDIVTIDHIDGTSIVLGHAVEDEIGGMAINSKGEIYISTYLTPALYKIDADSGKAEFIAMLDFENIDGIAFDGNDVLYTSGGTPNLYTIDVTNGEVTLIGDSGFGAPFEGMAFDPITGDLWVSTSIDNVFKIDMSTLSIKFIGKPGPGHGQGVYLADLQFDQRGNLYGVQGGNAVSDLISISKNDAKGPIIGSLGIATVASIAARLDTFWIVKPENLSINKNYLVPGIDTLNIKGKIYNPNNHQLTVQAIIESYDLNSSVTLQLFDDGLHNDSTAGDDIFGASWPLLADEDIYNVYINAYPTEAGYLNNVMDNATHFTSSGPVVIDSIYAAGNDTTINPGDRINIEIFLRNDGLTDTVRNITIEPVFFNACTKRFGLSLPEFGDIAPGEIKKGSSLSFRIDFADSCAEESPIEFGLKIISESDTFWTDIFTLYVDKKIIDNVAEIKTKLPDAFGLYQNYPNPFNPSTTIEFDIPKASEVMIEVYNTTGQKIQTLLNERISAGSHQVEFDANNISSGVYFYRIEAGEYQDVKKMIIIK